MKGLNVEENVIEEVDFRLPPMPYYFRVREYSSIAIIEVEKTAWDIAAPVTVKPVVGSADKTVRGYFRDNSIDMNGYAFDLDCTSPVNIASCLEQARAAGVITDFEVDGYVPADGIPDDLAPENVEREEENKTA